MKLSNNLEKIAIKYEGNEISYRELIKGIKTYGNKIAIEKEDRVIIFMENRPEYLYAFFGIWDKEGTCVCIDGSFESKELEYYIADADAKYIFTSKTNQETVRKAIEKQGIDIEVIVVDELEIEEIEDIEVKTPEKDAVALMLYTSGTTGNPKGVMLTYDNILANIEGLDKYNVYTEKDIILGILPMHHIFPLMGSGILPLFKGGTLVFLKELSKNAISECLQKNGITIVIGVPRLYELFHSGIMAKINENKVASLLFKICEKVQNKKLSSKIFKKVHEGFGGRIKCFVAGGSKLEPQVAKDFLTLGIDVLEGYGMTESAPMISFTPCGYVEPGSAGLLLSGTETKIADDGEIITRGRHVMKGYFNKPEATAETIIDGWLHTGDLGSLKGDRIYVTGRKKEMIVLSNGKNINPLEIESLIMKETNLIEDIAVIEYNKMLTAVIYPNLQSVAKEKVTNIKETLKWIIMDKYNNDAPAYKKVLSVEIVSSELPKTKLGKIRRFMLEEFLEETKEEVEVEEGLDFEEYKILAEYLKKEKGIDISPKAHLELDLGLDSLEFVELLSFLEHTFGVEATDELLLKYPVVGDLARYLEENANGITNEEVNWKEILVEKESKPLPKTSFLGTLIKVISYPVLKYYVKLKVEGLEKVEEKPCIYIANHQSFLDGFMLNSIFTPSVRNKTYYMAVSKHFAGSFKQMIAENGNVILVDFNKGIKDSLRKVAQILQSGGSIVIFPEGARTRDGNMGEFKKTFAILAKELEVPVVPVGIKGAYELLPYGGSKLKKGKVEIKFFNKVIAGDKDAKTLSDDVKRKIEEWVEE